VDREYLIVTYRTDPDALRAIIPAPLEMVAPIVKYEFIKMPDSTGFGAYTESGQVIPVRYQGQEGSYVHSMFLDDEAPIAGGRELWGFPKKLGSPKLTVETDTLLGVLNYGPVRVAIATMGYKHRPLSTDRVLAVGLDRSGPGSALLIFAGHDHGIVSRAIDDFVSAHGCTNRKTIVRPIRRQHDKPAVGNEITHIRLSYRSRKVVRQNANRMPAGIQGRLHGYPICAARTARDNRDRTSRAQSAQTLGEVYSAFIKIA